MNLRELISCVLSENDLEAIFRSLTTYLYGLFGMTIVTLGMYVVDRSGEVGISHA